MSDISLDELIAQREEATGTDGTRIYFTFTARAGDSAGETLRFSFLDPVFLTDDQLDDLDTVPAGPDLCVWYMGEDEYERFLAAGGSSNFWAMVFRKHNEDAQGVDSNGRPTRLNRSSRRARRR